MEKRICSKIHRINYLNAELNALYHHASLKLGLTDSAAMVLYTIYDNGENCLLSDIYKQSGVSKQTVNSAIRKLEKERIIYLEQHSGRTKKVVLTDTGKEYVQKTVARLFDAEAAAFASWTEEEINAHIGFMEKYIDSFREQIEEL
jgi:transcriptional regulator, MarR family